MPTLASRDGTRLAYRQTGSGAPLILVHGTGGSSARWQGISPALAEHFSVYALDRRGRGDSGDAPVYALEREFEDVAAIVESIGQPVNLLGHSYGGVCALEAALLTRSIHTLILYEPPVWAPGAAGQPEGLIDRLDALLAAGDRGGVLITFMQEVLRMPPQALAQAQASPVWPSRLAAVHTLPRELRAQARYHFQPERFKGLATPTLLLLGGDSPARFKLASEALAAALPHSCTVILPGQQHIAMDTAPELFVREVVTFLKRAS